MTATSSAGGETEVYLYGQENGNYTKIMGEVEGHDERPHEGLHR